MFAKLSPRPDAEEPLSSQLSTPNTLDLFIKLNYSITNIATDTEWVEDFSAKYGDFCKRYRLAPEYLRIDEVASKYNLDLLARARKKIVKNI